MDPVSQGVLGAVAALAFAPKKECRLAALAGCVGGMLADADIFIRSESDPLLNIEFHRHFSHSLIFIPIGGLIAALLLFFLKSRLGYQRLYLYTTAGYATAGLLDACTSYGTQLLWPFSSIRVSWSIISIIDPLFTLPLLVFIVWAIFKKTIRPARYAALWAIVYLGFGTVQNYRASNFQQTLIADRGHATATRASLKPSIANLILWRSIYLYQGDYYIDAVRISFFSENKTYAGSKLPAYPIDEKLAALDPESSIHHDLVRFNHFSDGYLAALPNEETFITDLRYSAIPNSIDPLWGLNLSEIKESGHVDFENRREISPDDRALLIRMLKGN